MANEGFGDYLTELFEPLGGVSMRRMFGGVGVFRDGLMFALLARDVLYLKSDGETDAAFEAEGCEPFSYEAKGERRVITSYRRVPERLFDETDDFAEWARDAFQVALRAENAKKAPRRRKSG